ncbi:Subtilisin-like protease 2 [Erysiphe necator]|uniref:Putative subtilisin-like protease n=1 Tax=Uncinula necator TaxID=52586 RepID=A0A0B1PB71_UNCNE|nr:Subtilisin-like protease 2 [Erysiphe necator]KHJ35498.1 putative subtilisin-like protease [Erysiphe necator]
MLKPNSRKKIFIISLSLLSFVHSFPSVFSSKSRIGEVKGLGIPISNTDVDPNDMIPSRYIVVYDKNATDDAVSAHQATVLHEVKKRSLSKRAIDGRPFSPMVHTMKVRNWRAMCLDAEDAMIVDIGSRSEVAYIEADVKMSAFNLAAQDRAPLGLVRLSHEEVDRGDTQYIFDEDAGKGTVGYVVDTGIRTTHKDYGGRARMGANFVNDINTDENGHGSHVAGTMAGTFFGVAKKAEIVGVKVLDKNGSGTNALVLQGIQHVAADVKKRGLAGKAVMNISIGGAKSAALNAAVEEITRDGVVVVVAAGNSNINAQSVSPASANAAITVGAIDAATDQKAKFSNFGQKIDIFAPGVKVESVGIKDDNAVKVLNGTSMASPHIAGLALSIISKEPELNTPQKVIARMLEMARSTDAEVEGNAIGTTKLIAYNGSGE